MEVLIVVLILAVAFVAFMGVMAQALRVASRSSQTTEAVSRYETLLFDIESGLRPDLAGYGGRGDLGEGYRYQVELKKDLEFSSWFASSLLWNGDKESMNLEMTVLRAAVQ